MEYVYVGVCIAVWLGIASLPANTAKRKGYSFAVYYVLCIFFFPIMVFIIHGLPDQNKKQKQFYYEYAPVAKPDQIDSGTDNKAAYDKIKARYQSN